ncbi:MAG: oxygenase MpaB family protein [Boseongicola sp.]|nr:oxygenase MpaB family protein [Boseongicola sp.]
MRSHTQNVADAVDAPSAYVEGYESARRFDSALADKYVRHTTVGDPELDPVMEEIYSLHPAQLHKFVGAGIEQRDAELRDAPEPLRRFFEDFREPEWLDHNAFQPGVRAFHANADLMLVAFVAGVLVEGFATLIAKSFTMTGRVAATKRRLQQNNRQLLEIFFPGGLLRDGDGWKLSTRVRFVHARIRSLLARHEEWDGDAWGTPVSAAHLGFAISVFSKRLLDYSQLVGASFTEEEKASILDVWRYTGYLMGIPESILYEDGAAADRIHRIANMCEPPPDSDSAAMANALICAVPGIVDIRDDEERKQVISLAYKLSRALIGNDLAGHFQYPQVRTFGTLFGFRMKQRLQRYLKSGLMVRADNFSQLLQISVYEESGLTYNLPDHVKHEKSHPW